MALVSENMAREHWRDPRAAIGKRIRSISDDWCEVTGVVADLRDNGVDQPPGVVYWPIVQKNSNGGANAVRSLAYVIRARRAGSLALRQEIQLAVANVNPNLPLTDVKTMESWGPIGISVWQRRLLRLCVPDRRGTPTFRAPKPQRVNYVNPLGEESPCSFSGRIFAMASGLC